MSPVLSVVARQLSPCAEGPPTSRASGWPGCAGLLLGGPVGPAGGEVRCGSGGRREPPARQEQTQCGENEALRAPCSLPSSLFTLEPGGEGLQGP